MKMNLCFPSVTAVLAACLVCVAACPSYAGEAGVLPLRVAGEEFDDAQISALSDAIASKIKKYPDVVMMPIPPEDALDIMIDAGCEDLDKACLVLIGKQRGADAVLYTTVAAVNGQFRVSFRYVEVDTGKLITADKGASPGDDPAAFVAYSLEEIIGPEPAAVLPDVMVNFGSHPSGAEVYVAADFVGITPVSVRLKPGRHDVRMVKEGFETRSESIDVEPSRENNFRWSLVAVVAAAPVSAPTVPDAAPTATAQPAPALATVAVTGVADDVPVPLDDAIPPERPAEVKKAPFYKTWWFWTIIGVAVVGAGTVAGVLATQDDAAGGKVGFSPDAGFAPLDVTLYR